ncbi:hypothetical protein SLH46_18560 [Draconibacterium sp. IB214405]|uniref:hypothetical protein n=1 Tax=Draconibacterium sp. IB214405 TaxID=3097352 RepID=UPI002A0EFA7A|nr:hypothetical protein [Draconibacterium sp. IB214405]MDX8341208.1 hypothetical protein [Draconibacterium sp. IB214405]
MNKLRKKVVSKVILQLDKHILKLLSEDEVDEDKLTTFSEVRSEYVLELQSIIKSENTSEMFDRKKYNNYESR